MFSSFLHLINRQISQISKHDYRYQFLSYEKNSASDLGFESFIVNNSCNHHLKIITIKLLGTWYSINM